MMAAQTGGHAQVRPWWARPWWQTGRQSESRMARVLSFTPPQQLLVLRCAALPIKGRRPDGRLHIVTLLGTAIAPPPVRSARPVCTALAVRSSRASTQQLPPPRPPHPQLETRPTLALQAVRPSPKLPPCRAVHLSAPTLRSPRIQCPNTSSLQPPAPLAAPPARSLHRTNRRRATGSLPHRAPARSSILTRLLPNPTPSRRRRRKAIQLPALHLPHPARRHPPSGSPRGRNRGTRKLGEPESAPMQCLLPSLPGLRRRASFHIHKTPPCRPLSGSRDRQIAISSWAIPAYQQHWYVIYLA
jgi:hypothetical protein